MFTSQQQKTTEYCKYDDHCPSPKYITGVHNII